MFGRALSPHVGQRQKTAAQRSTEETQTKEWKMDPDEKRVRQTYHA